MTSEPKPVAWLHCDRREADVVTDAVKHVWGSVAVGKLAAYSIPLYEQSIVLAMQQRIAGLEKVAEECVSIIEVDNCDFAPDLTDLKQYMIAAGYLGEGNE